MSKLSEVDSPDVPIVTVFASCNHNLERNYRKILSSKNGLHVYGLHISDLSVLMNSLENGISGKKKSSFYLF